MFCWLTEVYGTAIEGGVGGRRRLGKNEMLPEVGGWGWGSECCGYPIFLFYNFIKENWIYAMTIQELFLLTLTSDSEAIL